MVKRCPYHDPELGLHKNYRKIWKRLSDKWPFSSPRQEKKKTKACETLACLLDLYINNHQDATIDVHPLQGLLLKEKQLLGELKQVYRDMERHWPEPRQGSDQDTHP